MSARDLERVGEVVGGRYRLLSVIARGSFCTVYRACDDAIGRLYAVKRLNDSVAHKDDYCERLLREHRALQALAGTHAVRAEELCTADDGAFCLIMELLEGQTLADYLTDIERSGLRVGPFELLGILTPIADTLQAAHDAAVVHGDLRPENVFVLESRLGRVRLLDFANAQLAGNLAPRLRERATNPAPGYAAPELAHDGVNFDQRVDVYGLGAIVVRALCGRAPGVGSGSTAGLLASARPELPRDIAAWTEQVLAPVPDHRFWTVRAMWNALSNLLDSSALARGPLRM